MKHSIYEVCPKCQQEVIMDFVHGHYQCPNEYCKCVVEDCCNGQVNPLPNEDTGAPLRV